MRTLVAYVVSVLVVLLVVGLVANAAEGIIPLIFSLAIGFWLGNMAFRKISGKEPKHYSLFGFMKKKDEPKPPTA